MLVLEVLNACGIPVQDSGPGEVDLHGLYVKEAIRFTDKSIAEARARGDSQIRLIVGAYCARMSVLDVCRDVTPCVLQARACTLPTMLQRSSPPLKSSCKSENLLPSFVYHRSSAMN